MTLEGCQQKQEKTFSGSLETRGGRTFQSEGPDPGNKIMSNPFRAQGGAEDIGVNVVKASLDIKEQR